MQSEGLYAPIFSTSSCVVAGERRRDRVKVYAEVLHRLSATPLGLTELALFCRLNFSTMKECLDFMVAKGLVERVNASHSVKYVTTPRGAEFLQLAERIFNFVSNS
jgi:predicted transcriptional regulator